ncbi:MAG: uracil-DNA glycosylase [Ardenticatenia bacterium]|nr:uracil-DNA glycosylase [Ardenticatenia bacterium]
MVMMGAEEKRAALAALRAEAVRALAPLMTSDQTQVVFGAGDPASPLALVGEAPGPREDREGVPFVGPSGELLTRVLEALGLDRQQLWITNVVKVWPTRRQGRSRRTRPPNAAERHASRPFFEREMAIVRPRAIVLLGGTAAQEVVGRRLKVSEARGQWFETPFGAPALVTFHPSYIRRLQGMDPARGAQALAAFRNDLRRAAQRAGLLDEE